MKINQLIRQLEEAREYAGADIDVVVGQANGELFKRITCDVDNKGDNGERICIIQAHVVRGPSPKVEEGP